jgi:anti-sigma factor RsiW
MTVCPDRIMLLHGLLDDELDAANASECEAHLKTCPHCHAEFLRLQALREAITAPGVAHRAPDHLRARIEAALETAESNAAGVNRRRAIAPRWLATGAAGALAASLALAVALPRFSDADVQNQVVASHVRSLLVGHLTDVATSNQHVVKPWFNGKVDFAPPAPELAGQGFPLVGGRLDYIQDRVVPAIVYHRRLHTVNLFVWPADRTSLVAGRSARRDGYSLVEWTQGGLRFWAVSDIDLNELQQFRAAFSENSPR